MNASDVIVGFIGCLLIGRLVFSSIGAGMREAEGELAGSPSRPVRWAYVSHMFYSMLTLGGVLMVGFFVYRLVFGAGPDVKDAVKEPPPPWEAAASAQQTLEEAEAATAASAAKIEQSAIKARQREAVAEAKGVLEMVQSWTREMDAWDALASSLMTGEKGKALAAQGHLVKRYRAIIGVERPDREAAEVIRESASELLAPIEAAFGDPVDAASPAPEITGQLQALLEKAREGRDAYRKPRVQIEALLSIAAASGEPGGRPLAEVIREQEEEEAIQATTLIEAEIAKAREEKNKAIAEASRLRIEAERQVEVDRIDAETKAARLLGEREAARIRDEAEIAAAEMKQRAETRQAEARIAAKRRAFEREWPAIQAAMTPFTSSGYTQPGNDGYQRTTVEGPVSFGALQGSGFLNDSVSSLRNFQYKTRTQSQRPQGAFPWTLNEFDKDQPALQKIQSFLREYGNVMVEKGLLAE